MKKILILLIAATSISLSAVASNQAQDDKKCQQVYHDALIDLIQASKNFNQGYSNKVEFSTAVSFISTKVGAQRAICEAFLESAKNETCVRPLRRRYQNLRDEINLTRVLIGRQTQVVPDVLDTITEEVQNLADSIKCKLNSYIYN